jgi:hypothetical protein
MVGHRAPACATGRYRAGELIHTIGVTNPDFETHAHDRIRVGEVTALFGRCSIALRPLRGQGGSADSSLA